MKKSKIKEIMKVAAVSALSIGMFSAAFMGVNRMTLQAATAGTESFPPISQIASTVQPVSHAVAPEGFIIPSITVIDNYERETKTVRGSDGAVRRGSEDSDRWQAFAATRSPQSLSAEEAAMIGAEYIWDIFGESIDGMYVDMNYAAWPSSTRRFWRGTVGTVSITAFTEKVESGLAEYETRYLRPVRYLYPDGVIAEEPEPVRVIIASPVVFTFLVDSVTGERIDIARNDTMPHSILQLTQEEVLEWRIEGRPDPNLTQYMIDEMMEIAENYATRHFINTAVVDIEFQTANPGRLARDADGNLVSESYVLVFAATDDTGRSAHLMIDSETQRLLNLGTQHNDIVPGFNFMMPGRG